MRKLLAVLVLFIGTSYLRAEGFGLGEGIGRGWVVTYVTGTAQTIYAGRAFVKRVILSSGPTTSTGDYAVLYATTPNIINGAGIQLIPNHLFSSTQAITPAIVFQTTTTIAGNDGAQLNNVWTPGECDSCFIEIDIGGGAPSATSFMGGGLAIRKSLEASGGAGVATVIWKPQ